MKIVDIMLNAILDEPDLLAIPAVVSIVAQFRGASDHHTDVLDVARAAAEANASRLVLTHIGFPTPNKLIEDFSVEGMDAFYSGQIILGSDGMDIPLLP
jgi:ribonuclease BN (tRNA processing enzyme)